MATLGITFTGAALSMGGKKVEDPTTPPINAKSPDEESFVKCVHNYLDICIPVYLHTFVPTPLHISTATCNYPFVCASNKAGEAVKTIG